MLCTAERYQLLTGDQFTWASGVLEQALLDGQDALESALGRRGMLEYGERTEQLLIRPSGEVYPTATPLLVDGLVLAGPVQLAVEADVIFGVTPDSSPSIPIELWTWSAPPLTSTITYTGGYNPAETDRTSRHFVPLCFIRDIASYAFQQLHPQIRTGALVGANSVRSGDQAISYKNPIDSGLPGFTFSDQSMAYKADGP